MVVELEVESSAGTERAVRTRYRTFGIVGSNHVSG